jgi:hypothetical protein
MYDRKKQPQTSHSDPKLKPVSLMKKSDPLVEPTSKDEIVDHSFKANQAAQLQEVADGFVRKKQPIPDVIQKCDRCGDATCMKGEKCRRPPDGMFGSGSGEWGTKFYNQSQGHDGKPTEWEHPVPGQAYRSAGLGQSYKSAPVLQIPKKMHRDGVGGSGGGISSTGSSGSAKIWSQGIGGDLAGGDWRSAIWSGVSDGMNAAFTTGQDLQKAADGYYRIIQMHVERGDIDEPTAQLLIQMLLNTFMNMTNRPDLFGGPKKPSGGPGPGPGSGGMGGGTPIIV